MENTNGMKLICDGELEIVRITEDLYDQAIELYQKYFMKYENVSIATNLLGTQQSIDEMEVLIRAIMKDGVSFAAKHRETSELVGMCINKILNPSADCTLDSVLSAFKSPSMQYVAEYLHRMEDTYDLYKEWNINCVMEIVFLSTRTDFGRRGIGAKLSQHAIEFARAMKSGNVVLADNVTLPTHIKDMHPEAVCSVFTGAFSQKVGEKVGLETVLKVPNTDFVYEGKTFAEKIDAVHKFSTFAAMRL